MARYAVRMEYRGTDLYGFQRQKGLPTVQGELEKVLERIAQEPVDAVGAGRTDAGVHAAGQVVAFDLKRDITVERLQNSLNSLLPRGISVIGARETDPGFDPRRQALWREYRYFILNRRSPSAILDEFTCHIRRPLDIDRMSTACSLPVGSHDFSAFMAASEPATTSRTILECGVERVRQDVLSIIVRADSFLYRMVRIISSAVVAVGAGRMTPEEFESHLRGGEKPCAPPLPAGGLFLWRVEYEPGTLRFEVA
jgi:tRNA pseudouridine38-40 synthase